MKNSLQLTSLFLLGILLFSCSQSAKSTEEQTDEQSEVEAAEEVDQLTYSDVVAMVYDNAGEGIEWHGEEMPNDLLEFLSITSGDPCGEGDCGKKLTLSNTSDKSITIIVRGDYDLEGDQGYIPRKYVIEGGADIGIGCSHLCYDGEGYEFVRTIVASAYTEGE